MKQVSHMDEVGGFANTYCDTDAETLLSDHVTVQFFILLHWTLVEILNGGYSAFRLSINQICTEYSVVGFLGTRVFLGTNLYYSHILE